MKLFILWVCVALTSLSSATEFWSGKQPYIGEKSDAPVSFYDTNLTLIQSGKVRIFYGDRQFFVLKEDVLKDNHMLNHVLANVGSVPTPKDRIYTRFYEENNKSILVRSTLLEISQVPLDTNHLIHVYLKKLKIEDHKPQRGQFVDPRDKAVYKTLKFGKMEWMAENLHFKSLHSTCFNNDTAQCVRGAFYNREEALTSCPKGWHLPTTQEWKALILQSYASIPALPELKSPLVMDEKLFNMSLWAGGGSMDEYWRFTEDSTVEYWTSSIGYVNEDSPRFMRMRAAKNGYIREYMLDLYHNNYGSLVRCMHN